MNYIGIDLGDKMCGIAYTCEGIILSTPSVPRVKIIQTLKKLIVEKEVSCIVIGIPYDLYGIDQKQLLKTQKFIEKLSPIFPEIKIETQDERFTTFESYEILSQYEKKENFKQKKDAVSAFLILESYLKRHS